MVGTCLVIKRIDWGVLRLLVNGRLYDRYDWIIIGAFFIFFCTKIIVVIVLRSQSPLKPLVLPPEVSKK